MTLCMTDSLLFCGFFKPRCMGNCYFQTSLQNISRSGLALSCLSKWNSSAPTRWILLRVVWGILLKSVDRFQVWLMYTVGRRFKLGSLCIIVTSYQQEICTRNMVEVEWTQKLSKHKIVPCRHDLLRCGNNVVIQSGSVTV